MKLAIGQERRGNPARCGATPSYFNRRALRTNESGSTGKSPGRKPQRARHWPATFTAAQSPRHVPYTRNYDQTRTIQNSNFFHHSKLLNCPQPRLVVAPKNRPPQKTPPPASRVPNARERDREKRALGPRRCQFSNPGYPRASSLPRCADACNTHTRKQLMSSRNGNDSSARRGT